MERSTRLRAVVQIAVALLWLGAPAMAAEPAGRVAPSAEKVDPLDVGAEVPAASVRDLDGSTLPLRQALGDGPAALVFFRGGW